MDIQLKLYIGVQSKRNIGFQGCYGDVHVLEVILEQHAIIIDTSHICDSGPTTIGGRGAPVPVEAPTAGGKPVLQSGSVLAR